VYGGAPSSNYLSVVDSFLVGAKGVLERRIDLLEDGSIRQLRKL
jgi:hypothetical protein